MNRQLKYVFNIAVVLLFIGVLMVPNATAIQGQDQQLDDNVLFSALGKVDYSTTDDEWVQLTSNDAWLYAPGDTRRVHVINFDVTTLELYFTITNERVTGGTFYIYWDIILKFNDGSGWDTWYADTVGMACDDGETETRQYDLDIVELASTNGILLTAGNELQLYVRDSDNPGTTFFVNFFEIEVDIDDDTTEDDTPDEEVPDDIDDEEDDTADDNSNGDTTDDNNEPTTTTPPDEAEDTTDDDGLPESFLDRLIRIIRELLNLDAFVWIPENHQPEKSIESIHI
jgi:hypothetical protein